MYSDIKKVIDAFADEVQYQQIIRKCRLNNQIRALAPVLQAMAFRKTCYPDLGFFPNPTIVDAIWKGGITLASEPDADFFTTTPEQIINFPSL